MFLLADLSLHDERPIKRRKIESVSNGQVHHGILVGLQQQQQQHTLSCRICNQPVTTIRPFSCPSCQQISCERCTGQCDPDALSLADFRTATPPLDYDEEDDSSSSPSSPTPTRERIATPDPFDASVLRARLSLAARTLSSANAFLLPKKRKRKDPVTTNHNHNNHNSPSSLITGSVGLYDVRTGRQATVPATAFSGCDINIMNSMQLVPPPLLRDASRHQHHHHHLYSACQRDAEQAPPPATFRPTPPLRASSTNGQNAGHQGCATKLCSRCLVGMADGHRICIDCLEEYLAS